MKEKRILGSGNSMNEGMEIEGSSSCSGDMGQDEAWRKMRLER